MRTPTLPRLAAALALAAATVTARPAAAQSPNTDVYLAPLTLADGVLRVGPAINVTARAGYDNQPSFTPDGSAILYTSERGGQTDIYRYDLRTRQTTQVTNTPESEYSPAVTPDGRSISVVRVERDSTQRLWNFPLSGRGAPRVVLAGIAPVGYYAWGDARTLALFVLGGEGRPNTLQVARIGAARVDTVMSGVGRSLHRVPGTRQVSFLHATATPRTINALDPVTQGTRRVAEPLEGSEYFAWANASLLVMARDRTLYQHPAGDGAWREVGDLGVANVSRLAVSARGDWLAFVAMHADSAAGAAATPPADTGNVVREADVRRLLTALADDSMQGRRTATVGGEKAARLIAEEFRRIGLEPAGDSGGYLQYIPLAMAPGRGGRPSLTLQPSFAVRDTFPAATRALGLNVLGVIPGSDPALRDEVVVVDAHYDHLGVGAPTDPDSLRAWRRVIAARGQRAAPGQSVPPLAGDEAERFRAIRDSLRAGRGARLDSIYNGADDDASGTVAVIEIARALMLGPSPKRTVVFAAMTGEEVGLLGTNWYLEHPARPIEAMVANLEIEMIGRPDSLAGGPGRAWLTGFERSTMGDELAAAGVPIVADRRPEQQFFRRSDNFAFARRGIPAHTLSTFNLHDDYHTMSDEADAIDFAHMAAVVRAAVQATRLLTDGPKPEWKPGGRP